MRRIALVLAALLLGACHPVYPPNSWPFDPLAQCESSGRWQIHNGHYEGGLQFTHQTWVAYGGREFAEHAYLADRNAQITVAYRVWRYGFGKVPPQGAGAWPHCSYVVGMR